MEDWSEQSRTLERVGLGREWPFILKGREGAVMVNGELATPEFFEVLGLRPQAGPVRRARAATGADRVEGKLRSRL